MKKLLNLVVVTLFSLLTFSAFSGDLTPDKVKKLYGIDFSLFVPNTQKPSGGYLQLYDKKVLLNKKSMLYDPYSTMGRIAYLYNSDVYNLSIYIEGERTYNFYLPVKYTKYYVNGNEIGLQLMTDREHYNPEFSTMPSQIKFYVGTNNDLYVTVISQGGSEEFQPYRVLYLNHEFKVGERHFEEFTAENPYVMIECLEQIFKRSFKKM